MMPRALTAANGAKYLMMGEFSETAPVPCPDCTIDEPERDDELECATCFGSRELEQVVPVSWSTIKEIYAKAVDHFSPETSEKYPVVRRSGWRHAQGFICCGTMRIARADFDTDPCDEVAKQYLDAICDAMNNNPNPTE